jgi:hypothetical protein
MRWHTLWDECATLPEHAGLVAPLTDRRFRIARVQTDRIIIAFADSANSRTLPRDQFEALHDRITDTVNGFSLSDMPQGTDPYAAVLSLHSRYEVDEDAGVIRETEDATTTQVLNESEDNEEIERTEPDLEIYSDALLLIDALERHDPSVLEDVETPALINLYTLLSDVQRDTNDLRKDVRTVLLDWIHHDQPVHGQFGSIQRTTRRRRSLKDVDEVLATLENAGISREEVLGVDRKKVDEALGALELQDSAVYEIDETEYVRKAEVDTEMKESRLQGLKDQLALSDNPETDELQDEIEELEDRITELTEFALVKHVVGGELSVDFAVAVS